MSMRRRPHLSHAKKDDVTFPFNITLGIPIYWVAIGLMWVMAWRGRPGQSGLRWNPFCPKMDA